VVGPALEYLKDLRARLDLEGSILRQILSVLGEQLVRQLRTLQTHSLHPRTKLRVAALHRVGRHGPRGTDEPDQTGPALRLLPEGLMRP